MKCAVTAPCDSRRTSPHRTGPTRRIGQSHHVRVHGVMDSTFQRIVSWWVPARMPPPGAANVHSRSRWPDVGPGSLWNTSVYEVELSVPFHPVPAAAPSVLHDTCDAGMPGPAGGVNAGASACTLILRALPGSRFALEKLIVAGLGDPVVFVLTSVTEKRTADGTATPTVSCASAATTPAIHMPTPRMATRTSSGPVDPRLVTQGSHA